MMGVIGKQITSALVWRIAGVCVLLLVMLAVSVGANVRQWADHRAYVNGEKDRLNAAAAKAGLQVAANIASERKTDTQVLLQDLREIAERGKRVRTVYRKAAEKSPLAAICAPGAERIKAVNAGADK